MKVISKPLVLLAVSLAFAPSAMAADTYVLDPSHTNITWHANHFGFSNPSGKFAAAEGTVMLDEAKPENSSVKVTVKPASVITGIEKLDNHLKSKDFFDVEQFPSATFASTSVEVTGKDSAKVQGTLTLHGVSKPVTLDVKLNKIGENMMNKKKTAGFTASTVLKRSDFGINYALPGVSDDVRIDIEAEAAVQ